MKRNNKYFKQLIFSIVFALFVFVPIHTTKAAFIAWPDFIAATYRTFIQELGIELKNTIAASLKQVAISSAVSLIEDNLNDGDSPKIIRNFEDYLHGNIQKNAQDLVLNDFLTESLKGRIGADYTYQGVGDSITSSSYLDTLYKNVESAIKPDKDLSEKRIVAVTDNCNTDAKGRIADTPQGSRFFGCMYALTKSNPFLEAERARERYQAEVKREQEVATLKAISSGVLPNTNDKGEVVSPSILIQEMETSRVSLPLSALANSDNIPEILSMIVSNYIVSAVKDQF